MRSTHARVTLRFAVLLASFLALFTVGALADDACEKLASATIKGARIFLAQTIEAGKFIGPREDVPGMDAAAFYKTLPAFCRVAAVANPTTDSDIRLEVWLPLKGWNGKLQGLGNGGFAGLIDYMQLGWALSKGYVATATDAGHSGSPIDAAWALGHPERIVDFGHRGIHEMTRVSKEVIHDFYGRAQEHSYFAGCSDGGREALMEAQRYPDDYDGILAGAPANHWTSLLSMAVADTQALTLDPASYIPPKKIPAISAAVVEACDGIDGVHDGILNDPRQCHFDPASMQCKGKEDTAKCLTAPQVEALKKIYAGPRNSRGHQVFPGYLPGAEDGPGGWALWITGPEPTKSLMAFFGFGYFSDMVYDDPHWDYKTFNLDAGVKAAEDKTAEDLNATDPDLRAFRERGGKLILYHGWNDPAIPALSAVKYYKSVVSKMGQKNVESFIRLYMVPGMQHCDNGPGADSFGQAGHLNFDDPGHSVDATLERWVENDLAPSTIIAAKYSAEDRLRPKMTRPLCAYPQVVKYRGSGDTSNADNFVCVEGKK